MFGISTMWGWVIAFAATAAVAFGGGFKLAHDLDQGAYQALKASYAQAAASAAQGARQREEAQMALSQATGEAEAAQQAALTAKARVITREITHYVTTAQDAHGCVTWGMLRLHDAAALGVPADTLVPPAGQSDDACSPVKPSDFMAAITGNYAVAWANAEQLNALEADITQRVAVANGAVKP